MNRKLLLALFVAGFFAAPVSSVYANPDDDVIKSPVDDLIVVVDGDLAR